MNAAASIDASCVALATLSSRGGAAEFVSRLARAIASADPAPTFLICPQDFEQMGTVRAGGDLSVVPTRPEMGAQHWLARARALATYPHELGAHVRDLGTPGILHVNFPGWGPLVSRQLRSARARGWRVVLEVHDVWPHYWRLPRPLRSTERRWYVNSYRAADVIIVHTPAAKRLMESLVSSEIFVVPHGEYSLGEGPLAPRLSDGRTKIVLLGRLRENKGIDLAIQSVQSLRRRGASLELTIAGSPYASERPFWNRCKALIAKAPEGIDVVERFLTEQEMLACLAACDATILPYKDDFHSASGVALLSLSNGRPVITTENAGLSGGVVPITSQITIEACTREEIEAALERFLATDRSALNARAAEDSRVIRETLSWDALASRYLEIYASVATPARTTRIGTA